jgi:hypothetical protein
VALWLIKLDVVNDRSIDPPSRSEPKLAFLGSANMLSKNFIKSRAKRNVYSWSQANLLLRTARKHPKNDGG